MKIRLKNPSRRLLPIIVFGAVLLFGGLIQARAAVVADSSANSAAFDGVTGVSTLTWSHTTGTGANRVLFVGISTAATNVGSVSARVSSVTYGTQTLTRVTNGFRASPDLRNAVELFLLIAPASGTNTITVNLVPTAVNYVVGGSISFSEVSQVNPTGAFVSATNALNAPTNTATVTVTDSTSNDLVLDVLGTSFNAQSVVPNAAQTRRWRQLDDQPNPPPPFNVGAGSTKPGASPSVMMSWTLQNAQNWALGAIAVKAAPRATASDAVVNGRITTANGSGISKVLVTVIYESGATRTTTTNPFGFYRFDSIPVGAAYIFEVRAKHDIFESKVITVTEQSSEVNFTANP